MKQNLILGFCTGYDFEKVESFIASILSLGANFQITLFTTGMDERFYQVAFKHGIKVENAAPYMQMDFTPLNARYFAYRDLLRRSGNDYAQIMLTDVRDVFFQSNPFEMKHPRPVCFALEDTKIAWEKLNQGWIRDVYGEEVLTEISDNFVSCAGTTLGTAQGIATYLETLCTELLVRSFDRMRNYDQGIHNYIVWKLRPAWGWVDTADAIVDTVGCTSPERISIIDDLAVVDGKVPPVIHQWDRHPHLRSHVATSARFKIANLVHQPVSR